MTRTRAACAYFPSSPRGVRLEQAPRRPRGLLFDLIGGAGYAAEARWQDAEYSLKYTQRGRPRPHWGWRPTPLGVAIMHLAGQPIRNQLQAWGSNFDELADQVWDMMNQMESRNYFRSHAPHSWRPRLNLYETADAFIVCVELSGMPRKEIDVRAVDGILHVAGVRQKPTLPDGCHDVSVHLMEIDSGRFHRKVPIPDQVETEAIHAAYRHGYLWVIMPRSAGDRRTRSAD